MNTLGRAPLRNMISPENQVILNLAQDNDGANAHIDWMADLIPDASGILPQPMPGHFQDEVDFGFGGIRTDDEDAAAAELWEE